MPGFPRQLALSLLCSRITQPPSIQEVQDVPHLPGQQIVIKVLHPKKAEVLMSIVEKMLAQIAQSH